MQVEQRRVAKGQLIAFMQAGHPWHARGGDRRSADRLIRGLPIAAQCPSARKCRLTRRTACTSGQTPSTSAGIPREHLS
jgi:hypothetical protein